MVRGAFFVVAADYVAVTDPSSQLNRGESVGPPGHVSAPGPAVPYQAPTPAPVAAPALPPLPDPVLGLAEPTLAAQVLASANPEPAYVPPPARVPLDPNAIVSPIGGPNAPTLAEIEAYFTVDPARHETGDRAPVSVKRAITYNLLVAGAGNAYLGETRRAAVLFLAGVLALVATISSTLMIIASIGVTVFALFDAHAGAERRMGGGLPRAIDPVLWIVAGIAGAALLLSPLVG